MTDIFEVMERRRSIRKFRSEPVAREIVSELIKFATLAPSAMNRQDWRFSVVLSAEVRDDIARLVRARWDALTGDQSGSSEIIGSYAGNFLGFAAAPVLVAVDVKDTPSVLTSLLGAQAEDVTGSYGSAWLAVENLLLAAEAKQLGACVYTGCNAAAGDILRRLGRPNDRRLVCLVGLGWPDEKPAAPARKPVAQVMSVLE